jgi:ribonuclease Z
MAELLILGSGAALNDGSRETTMLALRGARATIVVDCGGNAVRQLQRLNAPLDSIERVILTHSHPDHTAGFALLVEMLWLAGRRQPLPIHGPEDAVDTVRRVWMQWDTSAWPGVPELQWHIIPLETGAPIAAGADFELTAAPGIHSVPVIGVRARELRTGRVCAYSADGSPSPGIRALAQGADLLVHEATGHYEHVHSSAEEAAELARAAGAKRLVFVHLAPQANDLEAQRAAAERIFGGPVHIAHDLERYEF